MKTLLHHTVSKAAATLALAAGLFCASSAQASVILLYDDFSDGNYTSDPAWSVTQGSWSVSDDAVHTVGSPASFAFLRTTDFSSITSGVFKVSMDVGFSSTSAVGNNRITLRMRDSAISHAGFEIAIAQGTMANTGFFAAGSSGRESLGTQTKTSTAYTFALNTLTTITWERAASGAMVVSVAGNEYMRVDTSSITGFTGFDTFEIGGRTDGTSYSFTNIEVSTVPEPGAVSLLLGAGMMVLLFSRKRRASGVC